MAITKLPAQDVILIFLQDAVSQCRQLDEQNLGLAIGLFGVLARMIIPEDQKNKVVHELRILGNDAPDMALVVEKTILEIEAA